MKLAYQYSVKTATGISIECRRTAKQARDDVAAINATRATRKHGQVAEYIGHIDRVGDAWAGLVAKADS